MASLVQDVWLGWEPRLRGIRLAPWDEPRVRLVFHLDAGQTLDAGPVVGFLEALGKRLEVVAWEPRAERKNGGLGPEVLADARRFVEEASSRWGTLPLVLGGLGLGGWVALAAADARAVRGAFALAPSLAGAGPEPQSPLRAALLSALTRPPLDVPTLLVEGRERPAAEAEAVSQWVRREPRAACLTAGGEDGAITRQPWPGVIAAWSEAVGLAGERPA